MIGFIYTFGVVFVAWWSSTIAVGPCDLELVAKLSKIPECYPGGKVPKLTSSGGTGTHIVWTRDDFPTGVNCVTAQQCGSVSYVHFYLNNGSKVDRTVPFEKRGIYLRETDLDTNIKHRLYIINNKNGVYSYYRCEEGAKSGNPQVNVAINCKYVNCKASLREVERLKVCFSKLGIKNVIDVPPCSYGQCI